MSDKQKCINCEKRPSKEKSKYCDRCFRKKRSKVQFIDKLDKK